MIPRTLDDLSLEWLQAALNDSGVIDVQVASVEVAPLGASTGFLGDLARLTLTYARGDGPASMVVKLPASDPGGRHVGSMLRAWAREVAFYNEVAPASSGARVPRCYHASGDDQNERWVVVLEDCDGDAIDLVAGASSDQAFAAVDALATFHGRWWQSSDTFAWMPGFDTTGVGGLQGSWLENLPVFLERYGHVVPEPADEWLVRFAPRLSQWSDAAASQPLTMVHADLRLDNLIFNGEQVTMIDWQTTLRGPGAMDLSSFLATGLHPDTRRAIGDELITHYLDRLDHAGIALDRSWFEQSFDENLLWWMGQFGNNLAHLVPDDAEQQAGLDRTIEWTYLAALDRNAGRLLD